MANIGLNNNQGLPTGEITCITKPYIIEVIRDSNVIITGDYEPRDPTILRRTDVGSVAYLDVEDIQTGAHNFTWSSINW
jgi:hypothetical protein